MTGETFALDLARFAAKAQNNARTVVRKVSIDLLTKVVMRTPVGNPDNWKSKPPAGYVGGRLRANWAVSIGGPSATVTQDIDKTGGPTVRAGTATINASDGKADIYMCNSLPYAIPIEYGHSRSQAPQGMVRVTVAEFQTYVANAVRSLPK